MLEAGAVARSGAGPKGGGAGPKGEVADALTSPVTDTATGTATGTGGAVPAALRRMLG
ncbi:hypothetical protein GCM10010345_51630 [Streptomyces canarius]|uniref:Uncharacterized protein n=1 Tax=Streptomyces canarius TaxID=285453 RepID=A0ABQ3CTF8_9ACTN|nr:hypothetical protein GCM10010345_51630 [Streptomyces canarius]